MSNVRSILQALACIIMLLPLSLSAQQVEQVTERDVELQSLLIDAHRERILGNFDKAIPLFEDLLKKDAKNHAAAFELSRMYLQREDFEKALRYARLASELDPPNNWYQQLLSEIYQKTGRNREAAVIFEQLTKRDPGREEYYFKWAYLLVLAGEVEKAAKVYDQLEGQMGINEEIARRKHALFLGLGDTRRAGQELERLVKAFPENTDYLRLLAEFYQQAGDNGRAREAYQRIIKLDPENVAAQLALAGNASMASNELQFLQSLRPIFEQGGSGIDPKIQRLIPVIQRVADTGNRQLGEAALELTTLLEKVHPGEAKAFAASADLLYHLGRRQEAIAKYEKTLSLDDTVFPVWEQLMSAYLEERNFQSLRKTAESAMDIFPNKAVNQYLYGVAQQELGKSQDALGALQQAQLMAGNDGNLLTLIYAQMGVTYENLQKPQQATESFEAALKLNNRSPEALSLYGLVLAQRGENIERALQMARLAQEAAPEKAGFLDAYGWIYYKIKDYNQAKQWIGKALEKGGDQDYQVLEHYGDVLFQLDDHTGALRYWNMALEKGSPSKLLEKKINDKQLYE